MAHRFAIESENITAEVIEAQEFMEISQAYSVSAVPLTAFETRAGKRVRVGSLTESMMLQEVLALVNPPA